MSTTALPKLNIPQPSPKSPTSRIWGSFEEDEPNLEQSSSQNSVYQENYVPQITSKQSLEHSIQITEASGSHPFENPSLTITELNQISLSTAEAINKTVLFIHSQIKPLAPLAKDVGDALGQELIMESILGKVKTEPKLTPEEQQKKIAQQSEFRFRQERTAATFNAQKQAEQAQEANEQVRLTVSGNGHLTAETSGYSNKSFTNVNTKANFIFSLLRTAWHKTKETLKQSAAVKLPSSGKVKEVDLRQASVAEKTAGGHVLSTVG